MLKVCSENHLVQVTSACWWLLGETDVINHYRCFQTQRQKILSTFWLRVGVVYLMLQLRCSILFGVKRSFALFAKEGRKEGAAYACDLLWSVQHQKCKRVPALWSILKHSPPCGWRGELHVWIVFEWIFKPIVA